MSRPGRIEDLEDVKQWIADHDGRIDELWRQQFEFNSGFANRLNKHSDRLNALEKKIMLVAGIAAAGGGALGQLFAHLAGV